jgi:serine/threonine protein kinase
MHVNEEPSAPELLNGRYVLTPTVRKGAQATVIKAFDSAQSAIVAIKRVGFGPDDNRARAAFEREAGSLQALTHPNIVRLIDVDRDPQGNWFLVLEWVERNLEDVVREDGPMSWTQFWGTYGESLLDAVCFGQNRVRPIAHRDIKPRNILITDRGVAKLAEYGIAKLIDNGARGRARVRIYLPVRSHAGILTADA